jgi:hypothetical protein
METLQTVIRLWEDTHFVCRQYRDTKDRFFITEIDELITQLEDNQMTI